MFEQKLYQVRLPFKHQVGDLVKIKSSHELWGKVIKVTKANKDGILHLVTTHKST